MRKTCHTSRSRVVSTVETAACAPPVQRRPATAAALGQARHSRLVQSMRSLHRAASPPSSPGPPSETWSLSPDLDTPPVPPLCNIRRAVIAASISLPARGALWL
eukprot:CAMPEP_0172638310 /NCGR_PEP_ID=MMETSP1068-20121228/213247_1 /TAXON_ID=35684 /ORGANISM="Pseudopedinella elastica, Strain CCMP716" /LENGTH=103 /DNA_ID=CAMNT_0013451185 /DNA_START=327 /DNA_END=641 /DNA_ORIENTATION=+